MDQNDDGDKSKRYTLENLFHLYCNHIVIAYYPNKKYDTILLTQIDAWLDQAKLLRTVFSLTDTGLTYMKFRKWRLDFEEFQEFLAIMCKAKKTSVDKIKELLIDAGLPFSCGDIIVIK